LSKNEQKTASEANCLTTSFAVTGKGGIYGLDPPMSTTFLIFFDFFPETPKVLVNINLQSEHPAGTPLDFLYFSSFDGFSRQNSPGFYFPAPIKPPRRSYSEKVYSLFITDNTPARFLRKEKNQSGR
jgi:hypothetical protein